jgi:hypothetical protein
MKKKNKHILAAIGIILLGFTLNGLAWSIGLPLGLNTYCLILGLPLMFGGFIYFLYWANSN